MLPTPTLHSLPSPAATHSVARRPGWAVAAVFFVAVAAHLPLLARHVAWLWERPHYQFFPLVLIGSVVLAYSRIGPVASWRPGTILPAVPGLAAAWALLAVADFLASAWLGCIAFMLLLMMLAYAAGGRHLCRDILPAWALLWLMVPPPLDLDRSLMFGLQNLTTEWSSSVLDILGVYHFRSGNIIEVDGRSMMVEQACSGINSLYSLLSCTLFLVLLTRRGWTRGGLLMAAAVVWVLVANVLRVTGVVWIECRWGIPLSTGWRHELFGVCMFILAVGLLVSTDQFISFLVKETGQPSNANTSPPIGKAACERSTANTGPNRLLAAVVIPAYLLLLLAFWPFDKPATNALLSATPLAAPEKDWLPAKIGLWEQGEFSTQSRDAYSFFGEHSSIWKYSSPRKIGLVSVDYPFPSWHDLTWCYKAKGWTIDAQTNKADSRMPGGFLEVQMSQPTHRFGTLLFCEFNGKGLPFTARPGGMAATFFRHENTLRVARSRLGLDPEPLADPVGPVYQFQIFLDGYDRVASEDGASIVDLFILASRSLRESLASPRSR